MTASVALQTQSQPSSMELIQQTLQAARESGLSASETAVIIKELVALQQSQERFQWEREERQARISFDDALNDCQSKIGRIAPNQNRTDTKSWWADYSQLDRTIRPIYTGAKFSIAYSEVAPIVPGKVRIRAELSRGGITKEYFSEITPSTTGPKGGAMATATDADAIAASRAKRYLLLAIFNIAVGIDKQEKEAIPVTEEDDAKLQEWADSLRQAPDLARLKNVFADAYKFAKLVGEEPKRKMAEVYEDCKRRLL